MKTMKIIYPLVFIFFILGGSSCSLFKSSVDKDGITLGYELSEGQEISVKSKVVGTIVSEQMGQSISVELNTATDIGFKVLSVGDNSMDIELKFNEMSQSMESSMGSGDTDFSELIGKKASFTLSKTGESKNFKGFDELPDITNANGETVSGGMYKDVVKGIFFKLPDHTLKTGDSWTNQDTTEMPLGGGILKTVSKTIYIVTEKLVVEGDDCFKIDITTTATTGGEFEQNGTQLSMERKSTSSGHLIFAYKKGIYLSMELVSKTDGLIDIPAAGMTIPQKISTTTHTEVVFE